MIDYFGSKDPIKHLTLEQASMLVQDEDFNYLIKLAFRSADIAEKEYTEDRNASAMRIVNTLNDLIENSLDTNPWLANFGASFSSVEDWYEYRKYFAVIRPVGLQLTSYDNYGLLVDAYDKSIAEKRNNFPVAVMAQNPIIQSGVVYYDTIGIADIKSGAGYVSQQAPDMVSIPDRVNYVRAKIDLRSKNSPTFNFEKRIHLVRFLTEHPIYPNITIKNNEELSQPTYNPESKVFRFDSDIFKIHNPTIPVINMRRLTRLHPATAAQFLGLFEAFAGFVGACPLTNEASSFESFEKIEKEILKYSNDPHFE